MSKVWFITGSCRGFGRAIATAREGSYFEPLTKEFPESWPLPLPLDVSVEKDVITAVKEGNERFARIDMAVNNAGYADITSVEDIDMARLIKAQIDANFMGTVHVSKACVPIHGPRAGWHKDGLGRLLDGNAAY